jgi:Tol biopolymer transport system component
MLKRFRRSFWMLAAVLLATAFLSSGLLQAKKGGGGGHGGGGGSEPAPPGFIYFTQNPNSEIHTYELVPDGSVVSEVSELNGLDSGVPYGSGIPSSLRYGADNHRWWIYFKVVRTEQTGPNSSRTYYDLYATPDGVTEIRVTNFSDADIVVGYNGILPQWSTGGDWFVSFNGIDVNLLVNSLYRVYVSAADLEDAFNGEPTLSFPILPNDERTEVVWDADNLYSGNFRYHSWSPAGDQVVFVMDDVNVAGKDESVWRLDLGENPNLVSLWGDAYPSAHVKWSPNGALIAFSDLGDVIVMDPNSPNDWMTLGDGSIGSPNTHPLWSPDNNSIAFLNTTYKGLTPKYKIYRTSLSGGRPLDISKNLDSKTYKPLLGWTPE